MLRNWNRRLERFLLQQLMHHPVRFWVLVGVVFLVDEAFVFWRGWLSH
jgi:hypothetical protein